MEKCHVFHIANVKMLRIYRDEHFVHRNSDRERENEKKSNTDKRARVMVIA